MQITKCYEMLQAEPEAERKKFKENASRLQLQV